MVIEVVLWNKFCEVIHMQPSDFAHGPDLIAQSTNKTLV